MNPLDINRILPAVIIFLAAAMLSGALLWYGLRGSHMTANAPAGSATYSTEVAPGVALFHTPVIGQVVSVGSNSITLTSAALQSLYAQPSSSGTSSAVVQINSDTEIFKRGALKDQAAFQQEENAFQQKVEHANVPGTIYLSPDPYTHIPLKLSDIVPGSLLYIIPTENPQKLTDSITAASIQVTLPQ